MNSSVAVYGPPPVPPDDSHWLDPGDAIVVYDHGSHLVGILRLIKTEGDAAFVKWETNSPY